MNILGRDGNISVIRIGTIGAVIGLLLIVGGIILFFADRATHQGPLSIDLYPGATLWYEVKRSPTSQSVLYQIPGANADEVYAFYQSKLNDFVGSNEERCVRAPAAGNFPEFDRGQPDVPPYQWSCMFDRSGFQITQYTRVNIQPGVASNQTEGMVIVEYEQFWQS
jgi:hypothetical protein